MVLTIEHEDMWLVDWLVSGPDCSLEILNLAMADPKLMTSL